MIKVVMRPHMDDLQPDPTAGISQVVKNYFRYLPEFGVELVKKGSEDADLIAIHAASAPPLPQLPLVSHCHGLYFTADSQMERWTHEVNAMVIDIVRHADTVTVPSEWVAQIFRRDMHFHPAIIPHGVEWEVWQGGEDLDYVLWNKNRASDACDPTPVNQLAMRSPKTRFLTTYAAPDPRPNIRITGTVDFVTMRDMIMKCAVYLASTKETFGIGTLEAMAAGKPILGFDYGGTSDLVKHGYNGYLARPGDYDDLAQGLEYCSKHRRALGRNASLVAQYYSWRRTAEMVAEQYARTINKVAEESVSDIDVIIPMYNKAGVVLRAIRSAMRQTHKPRTIIVVNNNSTDDFAGQIELAEREADEANVTLVFTNCPEQGVAKARNHGIRLGESSLLCCLDADDEMLPDFLRECRAALIADRSLGIAYTTMEVISQDGRSVVSGWPGAYDFDATLRGRNQVPTCCVFRRVAWQRAGGYRQRYAPDGAGSEDADLWLRIGLMGWGGIQATTQPLFRYYLGGAVSGNPNYREKDWRGDKGWLATKELPFAATATPANQQAHLVRQYDEPAVSVIIPVGPNHLNTVMDAIDSVEGQTFRQWELIVIEDGSVEIGNDQHRDTWHELKQAYPFVRWHHTVDGPRGAGHARNLGADVSKAPFLLFLDADDWLTPTALTDMMEAHDHNPDAIIYSDYIGHAYIDNPDLLMRLRQSHRLLQYNEKSNEATVLYHAFDYDCVLAQNQPVEGKDPYVWNVISSLVSRVYHREIGGFDETMDSWEDWDYWVRLARAGKCFYRLTKPLMEYRFYTGKRRSLANPYESGEGGRQLSTHLLEYMRSKYQKEEAMPCSGCGGGRRTSLPPAPMNLSVNGGIMSNLSASDLVEVELIDGNVGDHLISFQGHSYGYKMHGDHFKMVRAHAELDRRVRIVTGGSNLSAAARARPMTLEPPSPPPPPALNNKVVEPLPEVRQNVPSAEPGTPSDMTITSDDGYDLTQLWGINENRAIILKQQGVRTPDGLVLLGIPKVAKMFDLPELTAQRIVNEAQKMIDGEGKKKVTKVKK